MKKSKPTEKPKETRFEREQRKIDRIIGEMTDRQKEILLSAQDPYYYRMSMANCIFFRGNGLMVTSSHTAVNVTKCYRTSFGIKVMLRLAEQETGKCPIRKHGPVATLKAKKPLNLAV